MYIYRRHVAVWFWFGCAFVAAWPAMAQTLVPVSACGDLVGDGVEWYLAGDLVAPATSGTGLNILGSGSTLDLRGYTITYDADPTGLPNGGFEVALPGDPQQPAEWDLTGANGSVRRVSTSVFPLVESWFLEFVDSQPGDEIVSGWGVLPPGRQCSVSFVIGLAYGAFTTMPAIRLTIESNSGGIVFDEDLDGTGSGAALLRQRYVFWTPDTHGEEYRVRIRVTRAPSGGVSHHRFAFDEVHLRSDDTWGVRIDPSATDVTIRNGSIVQGAGMGTVSHAVRVRNRTRLTGLEVSTNGIAATAVYGGTGLAEIEIDHCRLESTANATFRWMDLLNVVSLRASSPGAVGSSIHDNTIISGAGFGCIQVSGDDSPSAPGYRILDNDLTSRSAITDHHAIVVYRTSNAQVLRNVIQGIGGQGIILSSGFEGARIEDNEIRLDGIKPNIEFGLVSFDGIRMNDYRDPANRSDHVLIRSNRITLTGGLDPWFEPAYGSDCGVIPIPGGCSGKVLNGIMLSANGENVRLEDNEITVSVSDPRVIASCVEIGRTEPTLGTVTWVGNTFRSNQKLLVIGGYADQARDAVFTDTLLEYLAPSVGTRHTLFSRGSGAAINDVQFVGTRFAGGATLMPDECYMRTNVPYDYSQGWHVSVRVVNSAGNAVNNRLVTIEDAAGVEVVASRTDATGWCKDLRIREYLHSGPAWRNSMDVSDRNPHRVTVEGAGTRSVIVDRNRTLDFVVDRKPAAKVELRVEPEPDGSGFRFWTPVPGRVKLEIFDLRGRRVAVLVDEWRDGGLHDVKWAGKARRVVAAGVYLLRLESAGRIAERKVVIR